MPRKLYSTLFAERVKALRENKGKLLYFGRGTPPPEFLGRVFTDMYEEVRRSSRADTIKRIFSDCDLELNNPFHWAYALRLFCDLHYLRSQSRKTTRSKFLEMLKRDRADVLTKYPHATQHEQARQLRAKFPDRYGEFKNENSLRRLFTQKPPRKPTKKSKKLRFTEV